MVKIDETDKNILVILGRDSRASATQISKDLAEK
jgi:DNA-binding Lrp family transcriptional regulator